jgi:hypothetical protein
MNDGRSFSKLEISKLRPRLPSDMTSREFAGVLHGFIHVAHPPIVPLSR